MIIGTDFFYSGFAKEPKIPVLKGVGITYRIFYRISKVVLRLKITNSY
jgi:hypothetical protein